MIQNRTFSATKVRKNFLISYFSKVYDYDTKCSMTQTRIFFLPLCNDKQLTSSLFSFIVVFFSFKSVLFPYWAVFPAGAFGFFWLLALTIGVCSL